MPINNSLTPEGLNALGAAFGYYPQLRRNRTMQDPQAALDMPLQALRGRFAGTVGMPSDVLNMFRTPQPMEMYGQVDYSPQTQVPYGTQELLGVLPFLPQGPAQQAAANVGTLAPITPMETLQAARLARQVAMATKGMPVGMSTEAVGGISFLRPQTSQEEVLRLAQQRAVLPPSQDRLSLPANQQMPLKKIRRFNDGGVEIGYNRGDSKILVTMAPSEKNDRMLSASLENIGGYPLGTGEGTMAYVDALESVIKNSRGKTVYWDGFTSETIQSDKARAIYDRLKAAGIPFEKNVFEGRSKNALSLTQEQLLNIDFNQVRNNLLKLAR